MTIMNRVASALEYTLINGAGLPSIYVENTRNDPDANDSFIKCSVIPTLVVPAIVGASPQQRYEGIFSLLVCTPEGKGAGSSYDYVDTLMALFAPSTDITYNSVTVSVDTCEPAVGFYDPPFYCVPVSVGWHIYN